MFQEAPKHTVRVPFCSVSPTFRNLYKEIAAHVYGDMCTKMFAPAGDWERENVVHT